MWILRRVFYAHSCCGLFDTAPNGLSSSFSEWVKQGSLTSELLVRPLHWQSNYRFTLLSLTLVNFNCHLFQTRIAAFSFWSISNQESVTPTRGAFWWQWFLVISPFSNSSKSRLTTMIFVISEKLIHVRLSLEFSQLSNGLFHFDHSSQDGRGYIALTIFEKGRSRNYGAHGDILWAEAVNDAEWMQNDSLEELVYILIHSFCIYAIVDSSWP